MGAWLCAQKRPASSLQTPTSPKRNPFLSEVFYWRSPNAEAPAVTSDSHSVQVMASVLAVVLLGVPVGTSLALCVPAETVDQHDGRSGDSASFPNQVVVPQFPHHCCGEMLTVDTDPVLQSDVRQSRGSPAIPYPRVLL